MNDFDKEFESTSRFIKASFIFIALLAITMLTGLGIVVYKVLLHLGI